MASNFEQRSLPAIASRLRRTREALGFKKQKDFAERAGIMPPTYNQWEKAKVYPDLQFAIRLRDEYNISLDWIYLGEPSGLPYHIARLLRIEDEHRSTIANPPRDRQLIDTAE
jgi:transcriptional regulator with XRE-family HTH domain